MAARKAFVDKVWGAFIKNAGHDANSFGHLKVTSVQPGVVHARMLVKEHQANRLKSLHGGLTSSWVLILCFNPKMTGVSTDIHVTFVRAAMVGEEILLKSEVVGQGKTLAYTRIEITNEKTSKLLAFGSHTKFIGQALTHPDNVKFSEDGETII
ncbi:hypothetical protein RQP46_004886 [Phenoliferia psychrophenolica]